MEVMVQRNNVITVSFVYDLFDEEDVKKWGSLKVGLGKVKEIVNEPGFINKFSKSERVVITELTNSIISSDSNG